MRGFLVGLAALPVVLAACGKSSDGSSDSGGNLVENWTKKSAKLQKGKVAGVAYRFQLPDGLKMSQFESGERRWTDASLGDDDPVKGPAITLRDAYNPNATLESKVQTIKKYRKKAVIHRNKALKDGFRITYYFKHKATVFVHVYKKKSGKMVLLEGAFYNGAPMSDMEPVMAWLKKTCSTLELGND